jgi:hypothetical protein
MKNSAPPTRTAAGFGAPWFKGTQVNYFPTHIPFIKKNLDKLESHLLGGWLPKRPFIDKTTKLVTFGSCFAARITHYLRKRGYNLPQVSEELQSERWGEISSASKTGTVSLGAGVNHTFAIRQLFEWAFNNKQSSEILWHKDDASIIEKTDLIQSATYDLFTTNDVFIITLGLSEVWYNKETGGVFWRAIPSVQYDEGKHGFRIASVQENKENLKFIFDIIKKNNPSATLIFTVSPVPLNATFRPVSCLSASQVTKATLRVAVDEFFREANGHTRDDLWYFPSFDLVKEVYGRLPGNPFDADNRHINMDTQTRIMRVFEKYYTK